MISQTAASIEYLQARHSARRTAACQSCRSCIPAVLRCRLKDSLQLGLNPFPAHARRLSSHDVKPPRIWLLVLVIREHLRLERERNRKVGSVGETVGTGEFRWGDPDDGKRLGVHSQSLADCSWIPIEVSLPER